MYLNKINMVLDIYVAIKKNNYKLKFKSKPWITRLGEEEKAGVWSPLTFFYPR